MIHGALCPNCFCTSIAKYFGSECTKPGRCQYSKLPLFLETWLPQSHVYIYHGSNNAEDAFFLQRLTPSLLCYKSTIDQAYHRSMTILKHMRKEGIYAQNAYASRQRKMPALKTPNADERAAPMTDKPCDIPTRSHCRVQKNVNDPWRSLKIGVNVKSRRLFSLECDCH